MEVLWFFEKLAMALDEFVHFCWKDARRPPWPPIDFADDVELVVLFKLLDLEPFLYKGLLPIQEGNDERILDVCDVTIGQDVDGCPVALES